MLPQEHMVKSLRVHRAKKANRVFPEQYFKLCRNLGSSFGIAIEKANQITSQIILFKKISINRCGTQDTCSLVI